MLVLEGNKKENFRIWRTKFDAYCITENFRDITKPNSGANRGEHYTADKRPIEIASLKLSLPDETLKIIEYSIEPGMTDAQKKDPWEYMDRLAAHYMGVNTLMSDRYTYWKKMKQNPLESMTDWEARVREAGSNCGYQEREDEFLRDKFTFDMDDSYEHLRQEIFWKEQQSTTANPLTFNAVTAHAKAYEAAKKTNQMITEEKTTEQVNWATSTKDTYHTNKLPSNSCWYCGAAGRHPARQCPAQGETCSKCGRVGHFARVCLSDDPEKRQQLRQTRGRANQGRSRGRGRARGARGHWQWQRQNHHSDSTIHQLATEVDDPDPANNYWEPDHIYMLTMETQDINAMSETLPLRPHGEKFFANLALSATGIDTFVPITCQIDTAATCNTIPDSLLYHFPTKPKITRSSAVLSPYSGPPIKPIGKTQLVCNRNNKYELLEFQVIPSAQLLDKPALISGTDSKRLGLVEIHADVVHATTAEQPKLSENDVLDSFPDLWDGIGCLGTPVQFHLKPGIRPRQAPIHRIPVAMQDKVCSEIDRLVASGQLCKMEEPTEWCSNMLIRERPGKLRLCIDPSQTINLAIERPTYQMPTLEENLHRLKKAKCFSLVDVREAFQHIPLTHESSILTTMRTPKGRYRWTRLPFGISSAPEEFQRRIHEELEGLNGICNIADDILIFGSGDNYEEAEKDHDSNITALLKRCSDRNIKLNKKKFKFKLNSVKFMGFIITNEGLKADPEKIECITSMPIPTNKTALLRYIGMVNYLSRFCPKLSMIIKPLRELTCQSMEFLWSKTHQDAFEESQKLIAQSPVLKYFDVKSPVILQVDASDDGLGGAILQPNEKGEAQPVAYTSCSLTKNEIENYAIIEKETLAICAAFAKWDQYLYGHPDITVHTDHRPLETIFRKPLSSAPKRLQKMMMKLQRYHFKVRYKMGKSLYLADTLSRAALPTNSEATVTGFNVFRLDLEKTSCGNPRISMETYNELREATQADPMLIQLSNIIVSGWPPKKEDLPDCLQQFWNYRDELTIYNGVIFKTNRAVVPSSLQSKMLQKIHISHFGSDSNIRMAKDVLYWPGMQAAIRDLCTNCPTCAQYSQQLPREPMMSHPIPELPWQYVSQDLCTYQGTDYLITVDHFSDYFEVDTLEDTRSTTIIDKTKRHFARFGIPTICLTDNGPQFISVEYKQFAKTYGFKHITSSPYHSQSNGKAEATVKIAKNMIKKAQDLQLALLIYRNTPPQGHSYSPAQRLLGRRTRGLLPMSYPLLVPEKINSTLVTTEIARKRDGAKKSYDKSAGPAHTEIPINDYVYVKPSPHHKGDPWSYGQVIDSQSPRSYNVQTNRGIIRRNRNHVRLAAPPASGGPKNTFSSWHTPFMSTPTCQEQGTSPNSPTISPNQGPRVIRTPGVSRAQDCVLSKPMRVSSPLTPVPLCASVPPCAQATPPPRYTTRFGRVVKPKTLYDA